MAKPTQVAGLGPQTPLAEAAPKLLLARLADLRGAEVRLRQEASADAVHAARVACRRLREAIGLFGDRALREASGEVKKLQDALGEVRDAQLLHAWAGGAKAALLPHLALELEAARARLAPALRSWAKAAPALEALVARQDLRGRLGGKKVARRLDRSLRRARRRLAAARKERTPATTHELRKAIKRLRYALEISEAGFGRRTRALLKRIEPLQDLLGDAHDRDARIEKLHALRADPLARRERKARAARESELGRALAELKRSHLRL